jgi:predicted enzyme related to lactoylglutathione lyase
MLKSIKSIVYPSSNLKEDVVFWTKLLGKEPYFNEHYYVGFKLAGYELGLDPNAIAEGVTQPITYWSVDDIEAEVTRLSALGMKLHEPIQELSSDVKIAKLKDANGYFLGIVSDIGQDNFF